MHIEIPANELYRALNTVRHLMATTKDDRAHLQAVKVMTSGQDVEFVAVNGKALAVFEATMGTIWEAGETTFKAGDVKTLMALAKSHKKDGAPISIRTLVKNIDETEFEIKVDAPSTSLTFLPSYDFPPHQKIMPAMVNYVGKTVEGTYLSVSCLLLALTCFKTAGAHVEDKKLAVDINFKDGLSPLVLTCSFVPELTVVFMPSVRGE